MFNGSHSITIRQRYAINIIRKYLNIPFMGRTKYQAMGFISKHYELAKKIRDKDTVQQLKNSDVKHLLQKEHY